MHHLTLYIPGLFHFIPEYTAEDLADLKSLRSLLNLGTIRKITPLTYLERISTLFALDISNNEVPFAAISRLKIDDERPEGIWMYADPVHLKPTSNGLVLFDSRQFALSRHDILAIAGYLNDLFKEQNIEIEIPENDHWYLKLNKQPSIKTHDIHRVSGKDIANHLPIGEEESRWISLFNDIQMRLHDCEINQQREQRGELPINSLWFWGAGEIPRSLDRKWSAVFSNENLVECLAMLSSMDYFPAKDFWSRYDFNQQTQNLIIINDTLQSTQYDEPVGWLETIKKIETEWLEKVLSLLKNKKIHQLNIITDEYEITLEYSIWLKFWRWNQSIHSFFE